MVLLQASIFLEVSLTDVTPDGGLHFDDGVQVFILKVRVIDVAKIFLKQRSSRQRGEEAVLADF